MEKTGLSYDVGRNVSLNATDRLRANLDRLEVLVGVLGRSTAEEAAEILPLFDETYMLLDDLTGKGGNVQAERVRFQIFEAQFDRRAAKCLKALGGTEALARLRQEAYPAGDRPEEHWWWVIDERIAERRRAQRRRQLVYAGVGVVVVIALVVLYQLFFAPDPNLIAKVEHLGQAEMLAFEERWEEALAETDLALTAMPEDIEALLFKGVMARNLNDEATMMESFAAAEALSDDAMGFLLDRAQAYLRARQPTDALVDLEGALNIKPDSEVAYYLRGLAHQILDDIPQAVEYFEKAAELATTNGNIQVEAITRVQLAQLMQAMMGQQMMPAPEGSATP